jgi:DNA-binding NarL/FixJ family response regulator
MEEHLMNLKFTDREKQLLGYIRAGQDNKSIAKELSLSIRTIEKYRSRLLVKTISRNSAHLVHRSHKYGWS